MGISKAQLKEMSKEPSVLCIYHSRDLDGWTSAAIVKDSYPQAELIGWDYGDPVPETIMLEHWDLIFIVDISFPTETMQKLPMHAIWIDHHPSAIKDSEEHRYNHMNGLRNKMYSACELTWEYTHEGFIPSAVHLIGMYDSFRHKKESYSFQMEVMNFQYAARTYITNPEEAANLLTMSTDPWINAGRHIFEYMKTEAKSIIKNAFPVEILGHKGMMVNAVRFNPSNFELDYDEDFFGCFHYNGNNWAVSLYSDEKIDCSVICKELGGGGHAGAAGFQRDEFNDLEQIFNS